jgi:hypothetical protein
LESGEESTIKATLKGATSKDIRNLLNLPEPGLMIGTSLFQARSRRNKLIRNVNEERITKSIKKSYYKKAAERYAPLL